MPRFRTFPPTLDAHGAGRAEPVANRHRRSAWRHACVVAICWAVASLSSVAGELPAWPDRGVAERRFLAGEAMFIERRTDRWHAWVLPDQSRWTGPSGPDRRGPGWRGRVLDFFSGALVDAGLQEDGMGHARPVFSDAEGVHAPVRIRGALAVSLGLFREQRLGHLEFTDDGRLDSSRLSGCPTRLMVVNATDPASGAVRWSRLVLRRSAPTAECPHGRWSSQVHSVLDLHDGTVLAVLDDRVVRLDMATLEPVGTGATVHVVDADLVLAILAPGGDAHARLDAALRKGR